MLSRRTPSRLAIASWVNGDVVGAEPVHAGEEQSHSCSTISGWWPWQTPGLRHLPEEGLRVAEATAGAAPDSGRARGRGRPRVSDTRARHCARGSRSLRRRAAAQDDGDTHHFLVARGRGPPPTSRPAFTETGGHDPPAASGNNAVDSWHAVRLAEDLPSAPRKTHSSCGRSRA